MISLQDNDPDWPLNNRASVRIDILDVQDTPPIFDQQSPVFSVNENVQNVSDSI